MLFKLVRRNLRIDEAQIIVDQIKITPNITGYSIREWLSFKEVLVAEDKQGKIVGVCLYYDFYHNWSFISVLLTLKPYRNMGIGQILFETACNNIVSEGKKIYTASKNPIVIKMMKKMDFILFNTLFRLPESYRKYELVFTLRLINWILSPYRLRELTRKAKLYGVKSNFIYGIKE